MKSIRFAVFLSLVLVLAIEASAQDATITYQGQLRQTGEPFTGTANLEFRLFGTLTGGSQISATQSRLNWPVEDGLFQVELNFGVGAFSDQVRFLEVRVNDLPLRPRQAIRPSPMALFALAGNEGPEGKAGPEGPQGPAGAAPFALDPATGTIEYFTLDQRLRFEPDPDPLNGPRIVAGHVTNLAAGTGSVIAGGGLGINTNSPQRQLHVLQQTTNNATSGITLQRNGSSDQWGLYVSTANNFIFVANNLGRGSINPNTGQYSALSDRRVKRDITPLENVLDRFLELRPSRYRMLHQDDQEPESIGLIAQEVQALFPEVVSQLDDDRLGLRYDEITVLNTQALIELNRRHAALLAALRAENDELRAEVAAVRSQAERNAELETRLAALEEMLLTGRRRAGTE